MPNWSVVRLSLIAMTLTLASPFPARATSAEPVVFPAYEAVRGIRQYATPAEYEAALADTRFVMERISYPSSGLNVFAYVYRPRLAAGRLPVIVFNRGSWTWPAFAAELLVMARRLAERGYLVVAPMYRGSGGAPGRDEMGGADLDDLMNILPVIRAMPNADPGRLYLYGESRGGMMVYQALREGFPARAAAVVGAFTDLEAMLADPQWAEAGAAIWPELVDRRTEIVRRRSAVQWANRIRVPILILHGAEDHLVSPDQSRRMAAQLGEAHRPFELRIVEGARHTLSERAVERDAWVVDWFLRHEPPPRRRRAS
jgi:dipeptidyl aminopeptidase/acylaminoacyl peptidase